MWLQGNFLFSGHHHHHEEFYGILDEGIVENLVLIFKILNSEHILERVFFLLHINGDFAE